MKTNLPPGIASRFADSDFLLVKTLIVSVFFALSSAPYALSQIPQGFTYQALAFDNLGEPIRNTALPVRISIESDSLTGTLFWQELHSSVTTNGSGFFSLVLGKGVKQDGNATTFADIDWSVTPKFIRTEIDYGGWKTLGASRLWSVPYAMSAGDLTGSLKKLEVVGETTVMDEALFEVKNKNGQTVFAVYNEGVRVNVGNGQSKAVNGGFAIGSFDETNLEPKELMVVTRDSVRVYIYDDPLNKAVKGGFAIGGFDETKGMLQEYLQVSMDSVRIYIDDSQNKASKGGFAIGSFDMTKSGGKSYFDISTAEEADIIIDEPRIVWYPKKEAFLAGRVLVEHPDSVGLNSFSIGYQSRAVGNYSQAMGYNAIARGYYSTSIGYQTISTGGLSMAIGYKTKSPGGASSAFGVGSISNGMNSIAMGYYSVANGDYSVALGVESSANGWLSSSYGHRTVSHSGYETVFGSHNTVYEPNSFFWDWNDRLFVVGNGWDENSRSNALTILKNGCLGLQSIENPVYALELPNSSINGVGRARANLWDTYSDGRAKSERKPLNYGLKEVLLLQPLKYYHHHSGINDKKVEIRPEGSFAIGLIAQDVYQIIPEVVSKPENEEADFWSMSYEKLVPVVIKAIQEQQYLIEAQQQENKELKSELQSLRAEVEAMKLMIMNGAR